MEDGLKKRRLNETSLSQSLRENESWVSRGLSVEVELNPRRETSVVNNYKASGFGSWEDGGQVRKEKNEVR